MSLKAHASIAVVVIPLSNSAWGHHNMTALFDLNDRITLTGTAEARRARDKSASGLMRVITLPGGKLVSACPQNC